MSEHQQQHQQQPHHPQTQVSGWSGLRSSVNGTTFVRSGFFIFLLGQVSLAAVGLATFLITVGGLSERFLQLSNHVAAQDVLISRMDKEGTTFSHFGIASDRDKLSSLEVRLTADESSIKKIDVMDEKITRIDDTLRQI